MHDPVGFPGWGHWIHDQVERDRMALDALVGAEENHQARLEAAHLILLDDDTHLTCIEFNQATDRVQADALDELIDDDDAEFRAAHASQSLQRLLR